MKIYFDEIEGNECALYYETEDTEGYAAERCIMADVEDNTYVDFHIEASIAEKITGIRIDMPDTGVEQLICIKNFTVNSAGIIQKKFNSCYFLDPIHISGQHGISGISLVKVRKRAYIRCEEKDPYWILSSDLVEEIKDGQSDYKLTRLGILLFIYGCCFSWKKDVFSETTQKFEGTTVYE